MIDNYLVFNALWEEVKETITDSEIRARVIGVDATMNRFDFLFGLVFAESLLRHTDNLSKTLQAPYLTASEGQQVADLTCKTLGGYGTLKHSTSSGSKFKYCKESMVWMKLVYHEGGRLLDGLKSALVKGFIQLRQRNCIPNTTLSALTSLLMQSRIVLTNLGTKHSNSWKTY